MGVESKHLPGQSLGTDFYLIDELLSKEREV